MCVCVRVRVCFVLGCVCAEQPVHVADAGSGLPSVRPAGRPGPGPDSSPHHPSPSAARHSGPTGSTFITITHPVKLKLKLAML